MFTAPLQLLGLDLHNAWAPHPSDHAESGRFAALEPATLRTLRLTPG
jgi:hypothetical protein